MNYTTLQVQQALNRQGYALVEDGIMGPRTEEALSDFKGKHGFRRRPYVGPLTAELLFGRPARRRPAEASDFPPWLNELGKHMYLHEVKHNAELRKWLKSDGQTLGDPAKLPWCGDAMETAIKLTLPDEPFPGNLGKNPYWARNWLLLGEPSPLALGVMVVAKRPGGGGHIASAVGHDPMRRRLRVRGGNQSNTINDTWLDEDRVLGYRKPITWPHALGSIPIMNSAGQVVSTNEA